MNERRINKKPKIRVDDRKTLTDTHEQKLLSFESEREERLPKIKEELHITKENMKTLRGKCEYNVEHEKEKENCKKYQNASCCKECLWVRRDYLDLVKKKRGLETEMYELKQKSTEMDYLLDVAPIIFEYEEKKRRIKAQESNIFSSQFTSREDTQQQQDSGSKMKTVTLNVSKKKKRKKYVTYEVPDNEIQNSLVDTYNTYQEQINGKVSGKLPSQQDMYRCKKCEIGELVQNSSEGCFVCSSCGVVDEGDFSVTRISSYKDLKDKTFSKRSSYDVIQNFIKRLQNLQGKNEKDIPQEVIDAMFREMKINRKNKDQVTRELLQQWLKKNGYSKYYTLIGAVYYRVCGKKMFEIPEHVEEKMISHVKEAKEVFDKVKNEDRDNFLNIEYVCRKICELLNLDHYIKFFKLLKSREKLNQQEKMWEKICHELNWEFIPSKV